MSDKSLPFKLFCKTHLVWPPPRPVNSSAKCILLNDHLAKHSIHPTHPIICLSLSPQSTAYSNMLIPFLALSTLGPATSALLKDDQRCVNSALFHLHGVQQEPHYRTRRKDIRDCVTAQAAAPLPLRMICGHAQQGRYASTLWLFSLHPRYDALCQKHTVFSTFFSFNQCLNVLTDCARLPRCLFFFLLCALCHSGKGGNSVH